MEVNEPINDTSNVLAKILSRFNAQIRFFLDSTIFFSF